MKKALVCILSLALLLGLTACRKSQAEPQPIEMDPPKVETPELPAEPEPLEIAAPETVSSNITAAPAENEDPQEQAEIVTPETAEPEPIPEPKTETPKQTEPKKTASPAPAETAPVETPEQNEPETAPPADTAEPAPSQPSTGQQIVIPPKTDNLTGGSGNYSPDGLTEEQQRRRAEKSGALLRGEGQLQWDENGKPYYVY